MLDSYLIPAFGRESIDDINAPQILAALRLIESRGVHETAHRCRALCSRIFRYAISTGRAERDPGADLRGALAPAVSTPRAAITDPERIGGLLRAIDGYSGHFPTLYAMQLAPLVFTRPGELRAAEWVEIDLDAAEWIIDARDNVLVLRPKRSPAILQLPSPPIDPALHAEVSALAIANACRDLSDSEIHGVPMRMTYREHHAAVWIAGGYLPPGT